MNILKKILVGILCVIAIFSAFKYIAIQKEKRALLNSLKQIEQQVANLEKDKHVLQDTIEKGKEIQRQLSEENKGLKEDLIETEDKLVQASEDFNQAQKSIEELNLQLSFLKDERDRMMIQLAEASQEKDALKAKVSSVTELKKAIRELKTKIRSVPREIKKKASTYTVTEGNRGFMTKNGMPTYTPKIKIKVEPALKQW